jgi:MFS family permease
MGKINGARVILGGLAAGVIINIFEYLLNGVILAKDMEAAVSALNRQMGGAQLAMFTCWAFLMGIFAVWLYAAIRPRYGAGPKTAVMAGFAVWCLGYLLAAATPIALKLFPVNVIAIGLVVGLIEVVVGTLVGAKIYHEEGHEQSRKAATA